MAQIVKKLVMIVLTIVIVAVAAVALVVGITNAVTVTTTQEKIKSEAQLETEVAEKQPYECILVLGASVYADGTPSGILQDRLDVGIDLYNRGIAPCMIMSGDNGDASYNEVAVMKAYAVAHGVPSDRVFCDHAGYSTYESMYRAQYIFDVKSMVVVTQTYHLYRALYSATQLGIDVVGVDSALHDYKNQDYYDMREVLARTKDFFQVLVKARPTYLGEKISLDEDGDLTSW